jgi:transcription antitermination protein NusB
MLSRRFLRIKVLQALYAFEQDGPESMNSGEKQLLASFDKLYELFLWQISLVIEISSFARNHIEEGKSKFIPSYEDLHPNLRFLENRLIIQLANNRDYLKKANSLKIAWIDSDELLRRLFNIMCESEAYQSYMDAESVSYNDDKEFVEKLLIDLWSDNDLLRSYFEERSIYWTDDFDIALIMFQRTIKGYKAGYDEYKPLPTLLKDENEEDGGDDLQFIKSLYRNTIMHSDEFTELIARKASNWDIDRIALMDVLLLKMAMTELIDFPSIPVKVTMNEYIELSKGYSTPRSKLFINGILDKLIVEFRENGRLIKTGRGLL